MNLSGRPSGYCRLALEMSRFSDATYVWLIDRPTAVVTSAEVWNALVRLHPELTTPSESRKTPRTTCMRDLRNDSRFHVSKGRIRLAPS